MYMSYLDYLGTCFLKLNEWVPIPIHFANQPKVPSSTHA